MRQAAAAITRCAQLCVQVRGLHLLNGTEREKGKDRGREGGERGGGVEIKSLVFDCEGK